MNNLFLLLHLLSILALIIGIIKPNLIIKSGGQAKRSRVIIFCGLAMMVTFILFGVTIPSEDFSSASKTEDNSIERQQEEDTIKEKEQPITVAVTNSEIIDVNYLLMWNNYNDDKYKDKNIRIAGKIDYVGENNIRIREGLEGVTGYISVEFDQENINQLESLIEGDYIIVTGRNTGRFMGTIMMESSTIEIIGEKAARKSNEYKNIADEVFKQKRLEAQKLEQEEMDEYKSKAKSISYENLIRDPYKYKGEIIEITIKVSQIMGGGIITQAGYTGKQGSNEWFINYKLPEHSSRILEGDTIKFYGEFNDVVRMKRALTRTEVYIPQMYAKYFQIVK